MKLTRKRYYDNMFKCEVWEVVIKNVSYVGSWSNCFMFADKVLDVYR